MYRNPSKPLPVDPTQAFAACDFFTAGFCFPPSSRLLLDSSLILAYLSKDDCLHPIAGWLFKTSLLLDYSAPRMFIIDATQVEYAHAYREAVTRSFVGDPSSAAKQRRFRREAIGLLESLLGPYPLISTIPLSDAIMLEWRELNANFVFGETDALMLAVCKVYGLDLVTLDSRLMNLAIANRRHLTRRRYFFRIYSTKGISRTPFASA